MSLLTERYVDKISNVRWTSTSLAHMADQLWNPSPALNIVDATKADFVDNLMRMH